MSDTTAPPLTHATIYRQGDLWICDCVNDPSAATCRLLFGTTALPMPYRAVLAEREVRARLDLRNPGISITRGQDR